MRRVLQLSFALLICLGASGARVQAQLTPDEVRQAAADAYVYGYPLVDNYRIYYAFAVDGNDTVSNNPTAAIPSSIFDSPYRISGLDLRAEPIVVTLPPGGEGRIWRLQLIDFYTRDFERLENASVPKEGGCFLVAGPNWNGAKPEGCKGVLRARSELALVAVQIQLQVPSDLETVNQAPPKFKTEPLSTYLGQSPPPPARTIDYLEPLGTAEASTDLEFFNELAFLLQFCPPTSGDAVSRQQLAKIGLVPGRPFGAAFMSAGEKAALAAGMADGHRILAAQQPKKSFADVFGTPSSFETDDATTEANAAVPNSLADAGAFEIPYTVDSGGHLLDGSQGRYTLTFDAGRLPPAATAWSLAMYSISDHQPVENSIDRYFISSPMLPDMVRGGDGSLTLFIQKHPPGGEQDANWLPAPNGPFMMILRLYGAEEPVLDNAWEPPPVELLGPLE